MVKLNPENFFENKFQQFATNNFMWFASPTMTHCKKVSNGRSDFYDIYIRKQNPKKY